MREHAPISSHPLSLEEVDHPLPQQGQILVRIEACGVCRTDLHLIEGELEAAPLPIIPGHQIVGTVAQIGAEAHRFSIGSRVGIAWLGYTCQSCSYCKSDRENLCSASRYTGYQENGGYAEYTTVLEDYAYPIPDGFSAVEAAPLLCAGIIGYRAYKKCELPPNGRLGIFGFGSSAHIVIQIALAQGSEIFVSTRSFHHQQLARTMGAHWVGSDNDPFPVQVDSAIVFAPVGSIVPWALRSVKKGGTVSLAGIAMSDIPSMGYRECLFHEKKLCSVEANTRDDGTELLQLAQAIPIRPKVEIYPMEQANEILVKLKQGMIGGTAVLINSLN